MASDIRAPTQQREKVALKPGFHLVDWFRLAEKKTPPTTIKRITRQELALHNTQFDCWTSYNGRVYDISHYLPYHPGGEKKLMLGAGKDCTALFNKYHAWINADQILGKFCIGILINEETLLKEGSEDNDDEINERK